LLFVIINPCCINSQFFTGKYYIQESLMAKRIVFEADREVAVITIDNAENGNVFNTEDIACLSEICQEISSGDKYKAVIITGRGQKAFSLGLESEFPDRSLSASSIIADLECPVIAAINGDAYAEGLELALACDIRIAVPEAGFCLPAIKSGSIPSEGGTQRLLRIVGISKAMEMSLTGDRIDASEALRIGLISSIVEPGELLKTVKEMAQAMTEKSPLALSYAKEAINKGLDLTMEQGLRLEADLYFLLHTTHDRSEGIRAFREKRKPEFKGK